MLWSESRDKKPVMTFPVKKRIHTELFIEIWATLYIPNGGNKMTAKEKEVNLWH